MLSQSLPVSQFPQSMHRRARKKSPVFGLLLPQGAPQIQEEPEPPSVSFSSTGGGGGSGWGVAG